jgi:hypothetical protein
MPSAFAYVLQMTDDIREKLIVDHRLRLLLIAGGDVREKPNSFLDEGKCSTCRHKELSTVNLLCSLSLLDG